MTGRAFTNFHVNNVCILASVCILQPRKYQLSNLQVSGISKSVVKDKKLTVHNSHPSAILI